MDTTPRPATSALRRLAPLAAVGAAGLATGALLFGVTTANAADNATGTSGTTGSYGAQGTAPQGTAPQGTAPQGTAPQGGPGIGGSKPVRTDEKAVTAEQEATLKAAALKAVPGGTVVRVETDAGDAAFEAHMTKADGTVVTVKFDENLAVTKVEDGMGLGDPAPSGAPAGQAPGGQAPGASGGAAPSASPSA